MDEKTFKLLIDSEINALRCEIKDMFREELKEELKEFKNELVTLFDDGLNDSFKNRGMEDEEETRQGMEFSCKAYKGSKILKNKSIKFILHCVFVFLFSSLFFIFYSASESFKQVVHSILTFISKMN